MSRMDMLRRFLLGAACISLAQAIDAGTGVPATIPIGLVVGWFDEKTSKPFGHTGLYGIMLGVLFDACLLYSTCPDEHWTLRLIASIGVIAACVSGIVQEQRKELEACPNMRNPM